MQMYVEIENYIFVHNIYLACRVIIIESLATIVLQSKGFVRSRVLILVLRHEYE